MKGKDGPTATTSTTSNSSTTSSSKDTAYKAGPLLRALTTAALMTLPQLAEVTTCCSVSKYILYNCFSYVAYAVYVCARTCSC
jgi:hypothetical protein